jgi:O-antigen ligase
MPPTPHVPTVSVATPGHWLDRAAWWAWLVCCALLPIHGGWLPIPLALAVVLPLLRYRSYGPKLDLRLLAALFAWYAWHVVGMLWTTDLDFGAFDLQVKLGAVLLPMAAAVITTMRPDALRTSMLAFTGGATMAMVLSVIKAMECHAGGGVACFTQSAFSFQLHPSYAAWYITWSLAYWGHALLERTIPQVLLRRAIVVVIALQMVHLVLLASKSGVLGLALVLLFLTVNVTRRYHGRTRAMMLGAGAVVLAMALWAGGGVAAARMRVAFDALQRALEGDPTLASSDAGSEMRLMAWSCSWHLLTTQPLGTGTGDVKNELVACYTKRGAVHAAEQGLNSHSQFLQGGAALGWPGLSLTMLIGLVPLLIGLRYKRPLLAIFAALLILNALVESVLEVQAGVVVVGLFLGLLSAQARTSATGASDHTPASP